jgi:hypothetical protein
MLIAVTFSNHSVNCSPGQPTDTRPIVNLTVIYEAHQALIYSHNFTYLSQIPMNISHNTIKLRLTHRAEGEREREREREQARMM